MALDLTKLKYLESHEWISVDGKKGVVGISDHAQREISDVVFIELPKVGRVVKQKESCMVIESVKAAFDIYSPASGMITKVNDKVSADPGVVNQSAYGDGWLFEIELSDPSELNNLLDAKKYEETKHHAH
jgi:glycine cleavage system H protein